MGGAFSRTRFKRTDIAPDSRRGRQAWTFSSSGWLFVYFFGVIKCLKDFELNRYVQAWGTRIPDWLTGKLTAAFTAVTYTWWVHLEERVQVCCPHNPYFAQPSFDTASQSQTV